MAESVQIELNLSKKEKYEALLPQLAALVEGENDLIANLANLAAGLKTTFCWHWVGFYLSKEDELVLGPFQGPVACTRIPFTKGVCGAAASQQKTIIVPDVELFPGHIACSDLSRSEIVVPFVKKGKTIFVLDVDSSELNDFDHEDQTGLEAILKLIKIG